MWITINNTDQTGNVDHSNFSLDLSLSDRLTTAKFDLIDPTSSINLSFGQNVMFWDENAAPDNAGRTQTVPTLNLVRDGIFSSGATYWVIGGAYPATAAISGGVSSITFNNQALTGSGNNTWINNLTSSLASGYVTPGQTYMLSVYVVGSLTPTNLNYYYQINWLDINGSLLTSTVVSGLTVPTTQVHLSVSGVAPANAVYAQAQVGAWASSATNSGKVTFSSLQIEPVWFASKALGNGAPVSYPSPDCNFAQVTTFQMPDGSCARSNRLFYGYISQLEVKYEGQKRTYTIDCREMGDIVDNGGINAPIDVNYSGYTDIQIINDLIANYFPGLLSTGQKNVAQPTSTLVAGPVIDAISFSNTTMREALNNLSDITGYAYYVDPYLYINYHPIPFDQAVFALVADPAQPPDYITTFPPEDYTYIQDGSQIRNSVKVTGGTFTVNVQDQFNGDGATKLFNLSNTCVSVLSISTNGGTSNLAPTKTAKIGVSGQDVNGVSSVVAIVDTPAHKVTMNAAPLAGTNNVIITYTQDRPVSILVEDNTSIGLYGRRFVGKVEDSTLSSNAAGRTRGISELALWAFPVQNITFKLSSSMGSGWQPINMFIAPGTSILATSAQDGITKQAFVVQTVKISCEGAGVNVYEYEAGVYRPSMNELHRNVQKSLARNPSTGGSTPIQLTYETMRDTLLYSDGVTVSGGAATTSTWGTGTYGYTSFS